MLIYVIANNITTEYIPQERPSVTPNTAVDNTTSKPLAANVAGVVTTQDKNAPERAEAPTVAQTEDANDFFIKRAKAMAEDPQETVVSLPTAPKFDIDPSTLDAATTYDIDINAIDGDKPWRQPGADMSDWFNYGFDEYKWVEYASRKKDVGSVAEKLNPFAVSYLLLN